MDTIVEHVDVWSASIADKRGSLSNLLKGMGEANADLNFIVARRKPEDPGSGVVFLTPLSGDKEIKAASTLGFNLTRSVDALRVEGENKPGAAAELTDLIANAGISIRGLSLAVIGTRYIGYVGFDSDKDAEKAIGVLKDAGAEVI